MNCVLGYFKASSAHLEIARCGVQKAVAMHILGVEWYEDIH